MSTAAPPGGASPTEAERAANDDSSRRRWALLLIAVAFLLVVLGSVGVLYEGNLVWLNRLAHPFLFGCVAAAAFGIGACRLISTHWLRVLVAGATIAVGGAWFCLGFTLVDVDSFFGQHLVVAIFGVSILPAATADAPAGREYKAIVYKEQSLMGDVLFDISIRQTRGLLSREWPAGCIRNDPSGHTTLHRVRWISPSRLRVTVGWEGFGTTIPVDPRTGRPKPSAEGGC